MVGDDFFLDEHGQHQMNNKRQQCDVIFDASFVTETMMDLNFINYVVVIVFV